MLGSATAMFGSDPAGKPTLDQPMTIWRHAWIQNRCFDLPTQTAIVKDFSKFNSTPSEHIGARIKRLIKGYGCRKFHLYCPKELSTSLDPPDRAPSASEEPPLTPSWTTPVPEDAGVGVVATYTRPKLPTSRDSSDSGPSDSDPRGPGAGGPGAGGPGAGGPGAGGPGLGGPGLGGPGAGSSRPRIPHWRLIQAIRNCIDRGVKCKYPPLQSK